MAEAVELGVAYLSIVPTMRGAQKTITRELNSGAATAGRDAGKTSGSEWGKAFKTASAPGASAKSFTDSWNKIASTQAVAGGKTFGDAFTGAIGKTALGRGLLDGVRSSMRGVEAEGAQGGKTLGDVFSGAAVASVEKMRGPMENATKKAMGGVANIAKGAFASVAGLAATALVKGFGRLQAIEEAQSQLKGLGHDAQSVTTIMENATVAVKGTAFGLGEAATAAASAVAAGIKPGQQLADYLTLIGDSATIAGADFNDMANIFNKVAAKNKVQGEELAQLSERGIPILALLGKEMGKSAEQVGALASKGKISFADFAAAMKAGMGGAAQESGQTFSGALDNVMASLGRIGANFLQGVFSEMPGVFMRLQEALGKVEPVAKNVGAAMTQFLKSEQVADALRGLGAALQTLWGWLTTLGGVLVNVAKWFYDHRVAIGGVATVIGTLLLPVLVPLVARFIAMQAILGTLKVAMIAWNVATKAAAAGQVILNTVMRMSPFGLILTAVMALGAGLVYLWKTNEGFRNAVTAAWEAVKGAFSGVASVASGLFDRLKQWFTDTVTSVTTFGASVRDTFGNVVTAAFDKVKAAAAVVGAFFKTIFDAIATAVRAVGSVFVWLWQNIIGPVFSGIASFVGAAASLLFNIFRAIVDVVRAVLAIAFLWLWRDVITPVWAGISSAISTAWTFISGVFNTVVTFLRGVFAAAWNWLRDLIGTVWGAIRTAISAAWTFISNVFNTVIGYLRGPFNAAWTWLRETLATIWSAITGFIRGAWTNISNVFNTIIGFLRGVFAAAWNWISDTVRAVWDRMARGLQRIWETIIKPAFDALLNGVRAIPGVFEKAKDAVGKAWDGLRRVALKPVEFVVQTILNQGLIRGVNKIGEQFGVKVDYIPWTIQLASGGNVPGWSPNDTADNIPAWLTAREFVTRRWAAEKMRRRFPGALEYINKFGSLPGYRHGGTVFDSDRPGPRMGGPRTSPIRGARPADAGVWRQLKAWLAANVPGALVTSAYRPTMTATGKVSNHARGLAVDIVGRAGTTMGQIFNAILSKFGGSALELIYSPAGARQVYRGRSHMYTGVTRANHFDHVHWAMGGFDGPAAEGGGFSIPNPFDVVGSAVKAMLGKIPGANTLPARLATGMVGKLVDGVSSWFGEKASAVFGSMGSSDPASSSAPGAGVTRWSSTVRQALSMLGEPLSLEATVLRRLNQESAGNARAVNNWDSNARRGTPSKGLMQVIDPTFRAYAMPGYNSDIYDPLSNILASMRYAKSRYGSLAAAYNRAGGYAEGGDVVKPLWYDSGGYLPPGLSLVANGTGRYETVRTHEQEQALRSSMGGQIVVNGIRHDSVPEFVDALEFAMRRREARGRYAGVR